MWLCFHCQMSLGSIAKAVCMRHRGFKRQNRAPCNADLEAMSMINPSSSSASDGLIRSSAHRYDDGVTCDIYGRRTYEQSATVNDQARYTGEPCRAMDVKNDKGLEQQLSEIRATMFRIESVSTDNMKRDQRRREIRAEWCRLALVLDRSFFVIFLGLIILSLVVLFPKPGG